MSDIILTSNKIDSLAELLEGLRQSKTKSVLLGQKAQQSKEFILISVKDSNTEVEMLRIGIISEGHGLKPQYAINEPNQIIVGFNKEICLISFGSLDKVLRKELDSLFYEFKIIKGQYVVLVICETEVYCLDRKLEIIWSVCLDLIVDYEVLDEYVKVITDEGTKVFSILHGHTIK